MKKLDLHSGLEASGQDSASERAIISCILVLSFRRRLSSAKKSAYRSPKTPCAIYKLKFQLKPDKDRVFTKLLTSSKYFKKTGLRHILDSSWARSWLLMASFLSLLTLLGSFRSICSTSSRIRYLSKSVPNFSESYKTVPIEKLLYGVAEQSKMGAGNLRMKARLRRRRRSSWSGS